MKIVIVDGQTVNPGDNQWGPIEALGDVTVYPRTPADQIIDRCRDAEVVISNKVPFTAETFAKLPKLKLIALTATGYNVIDIEAAKKHGVTVCNVPAYSTEAVAQLVFALLLELCHHVGDHASAVKDGAWVRSPDFSFWTSPLIELNGLTMGIVGFGSIGQRVGQIANAMGMRVIASNRSKKSPPSYAPFEFVEVDELFKRADVVSLHAPLTPQTKELVNAARLKTMKRSAFLINTARGPLVNEADLAAALNDGTIAGAGVDVISHEPMLENNPLRTAKNIFITPHIAWAPLTARKRVMEITAKNISAFRDGKPVNVVS